MSFWDIFLGVLFLIVCFLLVVIVLLQKGRGGGLGAAFGGMSGSAFGTKTGDVFTWVTIVLTGLFLLLAVVASLSFRPAPGKVRPPVFVPPPGPLSEPTKVEINCATEGATIRYTQDGTDPDEDSAAYERGRPIRIEPPTTLKARAFRDTWTPSAVSTATYTVAAESTTKPAVAPAIPPVRQPAIGPAVTPAVPPTTRPAIEPAVTPAGPPASAPAAEPATRTTMPSPIVPGGR